MKKLFSLNINFLLIIVGAFLLSVEGFPQDRLDLDSNAIDSDNSFDGEIYDIAVLDEQNVLFIGGRLEGKSSIFASNNGGKSWRKLLEKPTGSFYRIYFVNNKIGFVAGGNGNNAELYKTRDGGQNWKKLQMLFPDHIADIQFFSESDGYVVSDDGILLRTSDGGENWKSNTTSIKAINSFSFRNELDGWILADGEERYTEIFRTKDGGKTWMAEKRRFLAAIKKWNPDEIKFKKIQFTDSQTGYLAVHFRTIGPKEKDGNRYVIHDGGVVFSTKNGGETWEANIVSTKLGLVDAYFGKSQKFWVLPVFGWKEDVIFSSLDRGKNWKRESTEGLDGTPKGIYFADEKVGWLITSGGTNIDYLYRTKDGGNTWK